MKKIRTLSGEIIEIKEGQNRINIIKKQTRDKNKDFRVFREQLKERKEFGKRVKRAKGKDGVLRDASKTAERREKREINRQKMQTLEKQVKEGEKRMTE